MRGCWVGGRDCDGEGVLCELVRNRKNLNCLLVLMCCRVLQFHLTQFQLASTRVTGSYEADAFLMQTLNQSFITHMTGLAEAWIHTCSSQISERFSNLHACHGFSWNIPKCTCIQEWMPELLSFLRIFTFPTTDGARPHTHLFAGVRAVDISYLWFVLDMKHT